MSLKGVADLRRVVVLVAGITAIEAEKLASGDGASDLVFTVGYEIAVFIRNGDSEKGNVSVIAYKTFGFRFNLESSSLFGRTKSVS